MQTIDMDYKPWGGLAGIYAGEQQAQIQQSNQNALVEQGLGNVIKGVEAGRSAADFANPDMERWRQQGIIGKNMQDYSKGQLDYNTLDSNTKAKIAENMSKASSAEIEQTINGLDMFLSQATSNGPLGMQQAVSSLPPQYQQMVKQMGPTKALEVAKQMSDLLKQARADSPAVRGKLTEQGHKGAIDLSIHGQDNASKEKVSAADNARAIQVANIQAAVEREKMAAMEKTRNLEQMAALEMERANNAKDPDSRKVHLENAEKFLQEAERLKVAPIREKGENDINWLNTATAGKTGKSVMASHTMGQLRAAYKGKSDAEIKAAYKAKYGVEPRP
jgi:hypothetical protein